MNSFQLGPDSAFCGLDSWRARTSRHTVAPWPARDRTGRMRWSNRAGIRRRSPSQPPPRGSARWSHGGCPAGRAARGRCPRRRSGTRRRGSAATDRATRPAARSPSHRRAPAARDPSRAWSWSRSPSGGRCSSSGPLALTTGSALQVRQEAEGSLLVGGEHGWADDRVPRSRQQHPDRGVLLLAAGDQDLVGRLVELGRRYRDADVVEPLRDIVQRPKAGLGALSQDPKVVANVSEHWSSRRVADAPLQFLEDRLDPLGIGRLRLKRWISGADDSDAEDRDIGNAWSLP